MFQYNCLLLVTLLAATASSAAAQHMNEKDSPCAGVAVTSDLVACLSKGRNASEVQLNSLYQSIREKLGPTDTRRLADAEHQWFKYREANCSAERALYDGGTGAYPAYLACVGSMSRARTKELRITYAVALK